MGELGTRAANSNPGPLPPSLLLGLGNLVPSGRDTDSQSVRRAVNLRFDCPPARINTRVSGDFWAQPAKTRPFTTSTGFFFSSIWPVANLLPYIWTGQHPVCVFFFQCRLKLFFIVMTTSQELGHWQVSRFSNVAKLRNAKMKQKLRLFVIHQTATSLKRTGNLNPRTRWYPTQDESNRMESAYFIIHPGKISLPQNGCRLKSFLFTYL